MVKILGISILALMFFSTLVLGVFFGHEPLALPNARSIAANASQISQESSSASSRGEISRAAQVNVETLPSTDGHLDVRGGSTHRGQRLSPLATPSIPSTSSLSVFSGFEGVNQTGSLANGCRAQGSFCLPPDVQVAAGPNNVLEMVNVVGEIFLKNGTLTKLFSLASFYKATDGFSDPKVIYDASSGRFFASITHACGGCDNPSHNVSIAVSLSNDPSGSWNLYNIVTPIGFDGVTHFLADQPTIGVSDDKFAISANLFDLTAPAGFYKGAFQWFFNKSDLVNGATARFVLIGPNVAYVSVHPVQSLSATTTQYLVSSGGYTLPTSPNTTRAVKLFAVTGVPPGNVSETVTFLTVSTITGPNPRTCCAFAVQKGTTSKIDIGDYRVQDAIWFKGRLWYGLDDICTPPGDTQLRSCIRFGQLNTNTINVKQDFDLSSTGQYYYYPDLRLDGMGSLDVIFGYSNSTAYPSLAVSGQAVNDPSSSLINPITIRTGSTFENSTRYGDYFGAGVDPSDTTIVWVAGEYHTTSVGSCKTGPFTTGPCWTTAIAKMRVLVKTAINNTFTFQGFKVQTTGNVAVNPPLDSLTLSGTTTVIAKNATTGTTVFSKTYNINNVAITPGYQSIFLLNVGVNSCSAYSNPCPLSSNNLISYNGTSTSAGISVTRNIDINHNGVVDQPDSTILQAAFGCSAGQACYNPQADFDADGTVDIVDASTLSLWFGSPDYI